MENKPTNETPVSSEDVKIAKEAIGEFMNTEAEKAKEPQIVLELPKDTPLPGGSVAGSLNDLSTPMTGSGVAPALSGGGSPVATDYAEREFAKTVVAEPEKEDKGLTWEEHDITKKEQPSKESTTKYCTSCGSPLTPGSRYCTHCGAKANGSGETAGQTEHTQSARTAYAPPAAPVPPVAGTPYSAQPQQQTAYQQPGYAPYGVNPAYDPEEAAFVQTKLEHYMPAFEKMRREKKNFNWNWSAFLFGGFWALYRKMYVYGAAVLGIGALFSILHINLGILGLGVAVLYGLIGDYLYMKNVERNAAAARNASPDAKAKAHRELGGVSWIPVLIGLGVFMVLGMFFPGI